MTNQRINETIAEICGWSGEVKYHHTNDCNISYSYIPMPDYCADLNAMHEAEKVLNVIQWSRYTQLLNSSYQNNDPIMKAICHATARQRAEAFLRTLGKWEEAK